MLLLKIIKKIILIFLIVAIVLIAYFCMGKPKEAEKITWGVNFSQKQASDLGINWKEAYLVLLDDLNAKEIRIAAYWDLLEEEENKYNFDDLDWQIEEAEKRGARIILVAGMKTPRWPECHIPGWAENFSKSAKQEKVLDLTSEIIKRYENKNSIWAWQVENEPFLMFGECPIIDEKFLKKEIELVKSLDSNKRPVIITESGELSLWVKGAELGDIIGVTMYKKVWSEEFNTYLDLFYPAMYYSRKAELVKKFTNKKVMCVELQAEPWTPNLIFNSSLEEQAKTMDLNQFRKNINFAKSTGIDTFYLWGAEWWYWMKTENNQPEIWNEAKSLFQN